MTKKPLSFEEAMARLESIADEIEEGKIGLEESIVRYEEGMKLLQQCRGILADVEQRIIRLQPEQERRDDRGTADAPPHDGATPAG